MPNHRLPRLCAQVAHRAGRGALLLACWAGVSSASASVASEPPSLYSVGAAWDSARARLVLFGGYASGQYSDETWEWDGAQWTRANQTGPSPRNGSALAYDARHERIVLFGGDHGAQAFGDTWTWDGSAWHLASMAGPPARSLHRMVYDAARQRVLLYGGRTANALFGDTWAWDGTQWTQVASTGPAPRFLHALSYDVGRDRAVLFGGSRALGVPTDGDLFGDTWEWNGSAWDSIAVAGPPRRDHITSAFDAARGRTVLFGGSGGETIGLLGDTWEWNGAAWSMQSDGGPGPRAASQLVFDARRASVLLYGGFVDAGPITELWAWDGIVWQRVVPVAIAPRGWGAIKGAYRRSGGP